MVPQFICPYQLIVPNQELLYLRFLDLFYFFSYFVCMHFCIIRYFEGLDLLKVTKLLLALIHIMKSVARPNCWHPIKNGRDLLAPSQILKLVVGSILAPNQNRAWHFWQPTKWGWDLGIMCPKIIPIVHS
jgi:hypothetical protein